MTTCWWNTNMDGKTSRPDTTPRIGSLQTYYVFDWRAQIQGHKGFDRLLKYPPRMRGTLFGMFVFSLRPFAP